jgi:hypothetical protein
LKAKERQEMENCSFKPKINSDEYLKRRNIKRNSKLSVKNFKKDESAPQTPKNLKRQPFGRRIGSKEFLEFEFAEEADPSTMNLSPAFSKISQAPKRKKKKHTKKTKKKSAHFRNRSMTPTRKTSWNRNSSILEFRTPNKKRAKSPLRTPARRKGARNGKRKAGLSKSTN